MKNSLVQVLFLLGLLIVPIQGGAVSDAEMIWWWAPVIYQQDNHRSPIARENSYTVVNYDRDWRANNNWENLPYYSPPAAVYYSLVESEVHYFIGYYLYYPRHTGGGAHEHDMAGVMAVVQKDGDKYGQLELLLLYSNHNYSHVDGAHVRRQNSHPILVISAGTHEVSNEQAPAAGGDYPQCFTGNQSTAAHGGYRLADLQELWQQRNAIGQNRTFNRWGYFDSVSDSNAAAPWVWEYHRINWLAKPAELVEWIHGRINQPVKYLNNRYAGL